MHFKMDMCACIFVFVVLGVPSMVASVDSGPADSLPKVKNKHLCQTSLKASLSSDYVYHLLGAS